MSKDKQKIKREFKRLLCELAGGFNGYVSTEDKQWTIKGFIDVFSNVYTISTDTKVISKILEIHLFPKLMEFAEKNGYQIVLADHQNYYPDLTFVLAEDNSVKFAVDLKTTYRLPEKPEFCNGFTLGSHGNYFIYRDKRKNIQFPYNEYSGHFCLGIIYTRAGSQHIDETKTYNISQLRSITSVIKDIQFFTCEKWEIASDSQGSGNTANIGSIVRIEDILSCNGVFKKLGEDWFDDYWMNYGKIRASKKGTVITDIEAFVRYRKGDTSLINPCIRSNKKEEGADDE